MTQSLESINFKNTPQNTFLFRCLICNKGFKRYGRLLIKHSRTHSKGGESKPMAILKTRWTEQEHLALITGMLKSLPNQTIIESIPTRTPQAVTAKIIAVNQCLIAKDSDATTKKIEQYQIGPYLADWVWHIRRGAVLTDTQTGEVLAAKIVPKKEDKTESILRTIDEHFDALKDSFADLVAADLENKQAQLLQTLNEREELIKEQQIEIAALKTVTDAAKTSSLVARLKEKLSKGA